MTQEVLNILLSALGIIITGLTTFIVTKLTQFINAKIEDKKASNYLTTILNLVVDCVKETYQTYVETLKKEGKFDKEAQEKALNLCLNKIKEQMTTEVKDYVVNNFGDINSYLKSLIESTLYNLKNK